MTRAYVLDATTHAVLGLVDQSWERLKYTRRYYGMDTFEMQINRSRLWASALANGRLLYLPDEGDRLFLIEQVQSVAEGSAANDEMTVAGRSLEGIAMKERLVIPDAGQDYDKQTAQPAETAMKHYVSKHAGSLAAANRQVPNLNVVASGAAGSNVTVAGRYQTVFDLVAQIGLLAGIGWEVVYNPATGKYDWDVIVGVDRHASVFFDFAFETLERWEELDSIVDSKTFALIAGQGEGAARDVVTRPAVEPTGFDRREAFLDARDIDLGATTELTNRADAYLAAATKERRLEATVHQFGSFRYGVHWDMGDLVLVRNAERGISYTARVVEVEKAFDKSSAAPTVTAIIDRPFPTLQEQVSGSSAGAGAVDYPDTLNPKVDSVILDRLNQDVVLSRGAANRLDLASGDSLRLVSGQVQFGADVNLYRSAADVLATDDSLQVGGTILIGGGFLTIDPAAGATNEGGEIVLNGAAAFNDWHLDNLDGYLRWFVGGTVYADLSTTIFHTSVSHNIGDPAGGTGISLGTGGDIELSASTNPFIDFKANPAHDFDARLIFNLSGNGLMEYYEGGTAAPFNFNSEIRATKMGTVPIVGAEYTGGAVQTGVASGGSATLPWGTKINDTGNSYNSTNKNWTVPTGKGGVYAIEANCNIVNQAFGTGNAGVRITIAKNGGAVAGEYIAPGNGSTNLRGTCVWIGTLAAGDVITVAGNPVGAAADISLQSITLVRLHAGSFLA